MIKNERQFKITRAQAEDFRVALTSLEQSPPAEDDPGSALRWEIQKDAMRSQLDDLQFELDSYTALQGRLHEPMELTSLEDLPTALIKARIAAGLTQKQLAEKLGLKEQQLQRYEASGYSGASLSRLQEVLDALGVKVRKRLSVPELPITTETLVGRADQYGTAEVLHRAAAIESVPTRKSRDGRLFGGASARNCRHGFAYVPLATRAVVLKCTPPNPTTRHRSRPIQASGKRVPASFASLHNLRPLSCPFAYPSYPSCCAPEHPGLVEAHPSANLRQIWFVGSALDYAIHLGPRSGDTPT